MNKEKIFLKTICKKLNLNYEKYLNMIYFLNKTHKSVSLRKLNTILKNKMNNNISNLFDFYSTKDDLLETLKLNPKVMDLNRFKIYYKEKAHKLYKNYCKKKTKNWKPESYDTISLGFHIKKYGEIDGPIKYRERLEGINTVNINYWLKQGIPLDKAKLLQKERQATFTLEKCIKRHGLEDGTRIFNERQEKWQNTLNSKPQEEKDDINRRKGITPENMIRKYGRLEGIIKYNNWMKSLNKAQFSIKQFWQKDTPCVLYYIRFFNTETEFWKIGITTKNINTRFNFDNIKIKNNLNYDIIFLHKDTAHNCLIKEQFILHTYLSNRITVEYDDFKSTECFNENVLKDYII